jgi:hypothetical protein
MEWVIDFFQHLPEGTEGNHGKPLAGKPTTRPNESRWDFRFSQRRVWRWLSSGMLWCVVWQILTDVSEYLTASVIRAMIEALSSSEASVRIYETIRRNIPEYSHIIIKVILLPLYQNTTLAMNYSSLMLNVMDRFQLSFSSTEIFSWHSSTTPGEINSLAKL